MLCDQFIRLGITMLNKQAQPFCDGLKRNCNKFKSSGSPKGERARLYQRIDSLNSYGCTNEFHF